ncbi:PREDICTED: terminal uridylyltransferase 7-like, partial [Acropora digitifera]|uniref:terminal uridylyltransferase 7-like n=1 Tax=Acropora digitifera TaxID=70779 RepID=UPI00077AB374
MKSSDLITKQIESTKIYDVHGELKEGSSRVKDEKNLAKLQSNGLSDTEEDILITLSETESEKSVKAGAESKDVARESHKTKISTVEEVEYKFDPQIFRGNSRPVKTCCFCKKDGHIKENCPELKKPPLLKLPPMTPEFDALVDFACRTCRGFADAKLFLFGSSKNGFGFRNSDMDICMTLGNRTKEEVNAVEVITKLAKLLKKHNDCKNVLPITTAKVPIVKFFLRSCQREADISLYNVLALENTAMLATYAKLDDRVATLGYTVKVFAKVCDIGDASKGSLSSYAYILMMLHYLQQCRPPVIPVLQSLYEEENQPVKIIDNWNCWFCSDFNKINSLWKPKERNQMSAGYLWLGFFG